MAFNNYNNINKGIVYLNKSQLESITAKVKDCCIIYYNQVYYISTIWLYPLAITNTLNINHYIDDLSFITNTIYPTNPLINSNYQISKISYKLIGKVQTISLVINKSDLTIQQICYLKSILLFRYISNNGKFKFFMPELNEITLIISNILISSNHNYGVITTNTHIIITYSKPAINFKCTKLYGNSIKKLYSSISESIDLHLKSNLSMFAILSGPEGVGRHSLIKNIAIERQLNILINPDIDDFLSNKLKYNEIFIIIDESCAISQTKSLIFFADNNKDSKSKKVFNNSLLRNGRYDIEFNFFPPDYYDRLEILNEWSKSCTLSENINFENLALCTKGFCGSDLMMLCQESCLNALKESFKTCKLVFLNSTHFEESLKYISPILLKDTLSTNSDKRLNLDSIGGLNNIIEWPFQYSESFTRLNISPPRGVLLYGPPGCGKTHLMRSMCPPNVNFLLMDGASVISSYLGESELYIREIFQKARYLSPCILFIDELDGLVSKREGDDSFNNRVVSTFLNEMDGILASNLLVVGATNRPTRIDDALLRPGRLEVSLYIPLPDYNERKDIFSIYLKSVQASNIDFDLLANESYNFSGADIKNWCRESGMNCIRRGGVYIEMNDFLMSKPASSICEADIDYFNNFKFGE